MINKVSRTIISLVILILVAGEIAYVMGRAAGKC